ncbi:MAG: acetoacetate--CoA ligase [Bacteroidales bacterium]|nr:acetoacetate--CoA ligase [Bacteroidales bacterium]MDD4177357.1 acetoacetate--CoA ligase [Bacteroidales bacterium]MDD4740893.1 acetoacetate--CoA ligase [Bacteroidales bacterium]
MDKILWQPDTEKMKQSQMWEFQQLIVEKYDLPKANYAALHRWSVTHPDKFWGEFWDFTEVVHSRKAKQVVDDAHKMPGARWFAGARLNFAENLLQHRGGQTAIIFRGEQGEERRLSRDELYAEVCRIANGLRAAGVKSGDRIAAFVPNLPETVIAMLAAASIGAIWSSSSPDFGIKGVLDRFSQIEPKVIFSADGYFYNGRQFDSQEKLQEILEHLPSVKKVVLVDYSRKRAINKIKNAIAWEDFGQPNTELTFEQLPFDHPLYIMYSSGTTGLPKSIVHSAGGTLLQHLKELRLHCDLKEQDVIFYYTTCGWMMWNWVVSSLAVGSTLVLFDGNPFYPAPDALLKMADELSLTIFGTSAKYIASLQEAGVVPKEISDFPHLKLITSTGSPLTDESFEYVYESWKKDVQLSSIAGGTDIVSCFMLGNPILPVHRGEIQCAGLGMDIDCLDENGCPVRNQKGELVCKTAFPSMPVYFWNDPDNEKYHKAYFEVYDNIWHHGDYISISDHGGITMYGRSDATLNPGGVRIGTAEIYAVVENMPEVADSVIVGQQHQGDERVVLFVQLKSGDVLTEELIQKIKANIRKGCSPRHVPAVIKQVTGVPYTLNGKKVEVAVKKIIHGQQVFNRDALKNPETLEQYHGILD